MPGYQTRLRHIAIRGDDDLLIRCLLDHQQFHDPAGAAHRLGICSASWPLFGLPWPSGIHLAEQLAQRPISADEQILEIGCGLGLASLAAHRRGAHVTASDRHPLAQVFLHDNATLNGLLPVRYHHGQWGSMGPFHLADTGAPPLSARYDLIVGSDLLYDRDMAEALARFIDRHAQANAEAWIVDPNRGHRPAFNRHMGGLGFALVRDKPLRAHGTPSTPSHQPYKGRLLIYRRHTS